MTYIFDFDGVLANTFEPYIEFISKHFFLSKARATKLILHHTYKNSRPKMYEKMLEMFNLTKLELFLKEKPNILFEERVVEMLQLQGRKIILSRNYSQFVKDIMEDYSDLFDPIIGFDEANNKTIGFALLRDKYGVNMEESLFVTDTVGDILEAKKFLKEDRIFAANWGYNTPEELEKVIDKKQIISDLKAATLQASGSILHV